APTSALPPVSHAVAINGYSQPGASVNTLAVGNNAVLLIEINGAGAGDVSGLTITGAGAKVSGLVINRFSNAGVLVAGPAATGAVVAGDFVGTDPSGTAAQGNGSSGLAASAGVIVRDGASGATVGGANAADRNLISGNNGEGVLIFKTDDFDTRNNTVQNNYIGTHPNTTPPLRHTP